MFVKKNVIDFSLFQTILINFESNSISLYSCQEKNFTCPFPHMSLSFFFEPHLPFLSLIFPKIPPNCFKGKLMAWIVRLNHRLFLNANFYEILLNPA